MISDLTIVIQGRCEDEQLTLWKENYTNWDVIISTWEGYNIPFDIPSNWKVIKSDPNHIFDFVGRGHIQNIEYQIVSTLAGLDEVKTQYVVKVRGDEYWSNIDKVYNKMKLNENKILCSSMFFRTIDYSYPFHISDHINCGTLDNIKLLFNSAKQNLINDVRTMNAPEVILGNSFIMYKENWTVAQMFKVASEYNSAPWVKKWFSVIDINELKPYIATQKDTDTGERIYYRDNYEEGVITDL